MAELTRGQKAARTRARNKAAAQAKSEAETQRSTPVDVYSTAGPTLPDINAMWTEAEAVVDMAVKQNLTIASLSVAKEIRGKVVELTLLDGAWFVSQS